MKRSVFLYGVVFLSIILSGCGGDEKPASRGGPGETTAAAPTLPGSQTQTVVGDTTGQQTQDIGGVVDRITASNKTDDELYAYSQNASDFFVRMNLYYYFTDLRAQAGLPPLPFQYTDINKQKVTQLITSLQEKTTIDAFESQALDGTYKLKAITDASYATFNYLEDEDQNKTDMTLMEIARDSAFVLLRFSHVFRLPNAGKEFDGGLLLLKTGSSSGTNAWVIRDTVVPTKVSLLEERGGSLAGLIFKNRLRNGIGAAAIFVGE